MTSRTAIYGPVNEFVYALFRHRPPSPEDAGPNKIKVVFDLVRDLTKLEYERAAEAIREIARSLEGFDNNLARSFTDLDDSQTRLSATFRSNDSLQDFVGWAPELLHRITNFSVALVMHQQYVLSDVEHRYGKGSVEHLEVAKIFSNLYDSSFAYRIVYGFRNAIVHSSIRLVSYRAASRLVAAPDGSESTENTAQVHLIRPSFAKTRPNAKLRDEVMSMADNPELLEACRIAFDATKTAQVKLDPYLHPSRGAAVQTLWTYLVETAALGGYGPHFHRLESADWLKDMQILPMSQTIIDYVWRTGVMAALKPDYKLGGSSSS